MYSQISSHVLRGGETQRVDTGGMGLRGGDFAIAAGNMNFVFFAFGLFSSYINLDDDLP